MRNLHWFDFDCRAGDNWQVASTQTTTTTVMTTTTTTTATMGGKKKRRRRWGAERFDLNIFYQLEDPWPNTHLPTNKHLNILCRPPPSCPSTIISKCICPHIKMYLPKLQNVFEQAAPMTPLDYRLRRESRRRNLYRNVSFLNRWRFTYVWFLCFLLNPKAVGPGYFPLYHNFLFYLTCVKLNITNIMTKHPPSVCK